jgi:phospholipase A1
MKYLDMGMRAFSSRLNYRYLLLVVLAGWVLPGLSQANDLNLCMSKMMETASDSTTLGELRAQCKKQLDEKAIVVQAIETPPTSNRLIADKENALQPFTLMSHKPVYFLAGAYNSDGYSAQYFQEQYDDPSIKFKDIEGQFQISLKVPLGIDVFNTFDVYAAYTNRSFWQVYSSEISAPFRETNHEPEAWLQFTPGWEVFGFKNVANAIGFVHQSNGRAGLLSRSWNRVYANFVFARGNFAFGIKPWIRISEDADVDDNPDITDYLGHYELRAAYKWNDHVFSAMSRNNLESGFERGALELGWSFPLGSYPYLKGYVQYFRGYGESLIDYDQRVNRIGVGILLADFL